ncbi:MAG: undecaprenyldiphospho-muramoylpentapeptide beta-N-acetylglucosaminyltransferase [Deltaproteobacteria bacterium]|nr:MAG: undecaprenyldiphospho-muramoylpentapeptide beta-N-acetylglucosaminyltransferase [Deltaproteobacteria bacterium]
MKIIIAGGGTGGHLFPGIALAEEFVLRDPKNQILFVGTIKGLEAEVVPKSGYPIRFIKVEGIKGRKLGSKLRVAGKIPLSLLQSYQIIRSLHPHLVVGVGGYASGPLVVTAWALGIPTVIHEQNAYPGITNRILCRLVKRIFISFQETMIYFPPGKTRLTGNPVRRQFREGSGETKENKDKFSLLLLGGSQGSHRINTTMLEALNYLRDIGQSIKIVHQTGVKDFESVSRAYQASGFDAEVKLFIDDIGRAYRQADLIICRAGATTIAELTVSRRPAVLIPFPHAAANHQRFNAQTLADKGAAELILEDDLNGELIAKAIMKYYHNRELLEEMGERSGNIAHPQSAEEIVNECYRLVFPSAENAACSVSGGKE